MSAVWAYIKLGEKIKKGYKYDEKQPAVHNPNEHLVSSTPDQKGFRQAIAYWPHHLVPLPGSWRGGCVYKTWLQEDNLTDLVGKSKGGNFFIWLGKLPLAGLKTHTWLQLTGNWKQDWDAS